MKSKMQFPSFRVAITRASVASNLEKDFFPGPVFRKLPSWLPVFFYARLRDRVCDKASLAINETINNVPVVVKESGKHKRLVFAIKGAKDLINVLMRADGYVQLIAENANDAVISSETLGKIIDAMVKKGLKRENISIHIKNAANDGMNDGDIFFTQVPFDTLRKAAVIKEELSSHSPKLLNAHIINDWVEFAFEIESSPKSSKFIVLARITGKSVALVAGEVLPAMALFTKLGQINGKLLQFDINLKAGVALRTDNSVAVPIQAQIISLYEKIIRPLANVGCHVLIEKGAAFRFLPNAGLTIKIREQEHIFFVHANPFNFGFAFYSESVFGLMAAIKLLNILKIGNDRPIGHNFYLMVKDGSGMSYIRLEKNYTNNYDYTSILSSLLEKIGQSDFIVFKGFEIDWIYGFYTNGLVLKFETCGVLLFLSLHPSRADLFVARPVNDLDGIKELNIQSAITNFREYIKTIFKADTTIKIHRIDLPNTP